MRREGRKGGLRAVRAVRDRAGMVWRGVRMGW